MITEQYRMNPEISQFPSKAFYESKLINGKIVILRENPVPIQCLLDKAPRYAFVDLISSQEESICKKSYSNSSEAKFIINTIKEIEKLWILDGINIYDTKDSIGIITPYRGQVDTIKKLLRNERISIKVEVNTVDSFQGREKDIIIISTVRAGSKSVGFLSDYRRMNVAITRAKHFLWVIGSTSTLMMDHYWKQFI